MLIENSETFLVDAVSGKQPSIFYGSAAPDATRFFTRKAVGSTYFRKLATGHIQRWDKVKNDGYAGDWLCLYGLISDRIAVSELTDGGGAAGTYDLANQVPIYATVEYSTIKDVTGFAGDTSCVVILGETGDTDRYMTGTPSVFATATQIDVGVPSGTKYHSAAKTPVLTLTSATDITAVITNGAGRLTAEIRYHF